MVLRVAVAGVTNGLGDAIASALLDSSDLEVLLFTRASSSSSNLSHFTTRGAVIKPVDYSSVPALESALTGVDTVISTIFPHNDPSVTFNLIAAAKAAGVRRFAPSDFAFTRAANDRLALYASKRQIWDTLKESGMEYTSFQTGIFMDYFTFGAPKPHEGPLKVFPFIVNIAAGKATIPGTGNEKITYTTLKDIGRLVTAAVKLEGKWPEELGIQGETTTMNQIVRDIETITGKKLEVEYLNEEGLARALEGSKENEMMFFYNQALQVIADNEGWVTPTLNRLAPNIPVTSIKELIAEYWNA